MIEGKNFIGFKRSGEGSKAFFAENPKTDEKLPEAFFTATEDEFNQALQLAATTFDVYKNIASPQKAAFLRAIAEEILNLGDELVNRASLETALPLARIQSERTRTMFQLTSFAEVLEEGSWLEASIDTANPDRQPVPKPDLRKMLIPVGVVGVFGASNFPLAYSVAGVDTAAALAAGCPVVVKAHPAHPGTSELVASAIVKAAQKTGMPEGVFSMLFDDGFAIGQALVKHPAVKAIGFTGSFKGGMALHKMAQERPEPIPVFAEMSSINPVILFPKALQSRYKEIARQYTVSVCSGMGQFCTNPGLMFAIDSPALYDFIAEYKQLVSDTSGETMLTSGIARNFYQKREELLSQKGVSVLAVSDKKTGEDKNQATPTIATVVGKDFLGNLVLQEEVFGPFSLLVICESKEELEKCIETVNGQLTASLIIDNEEEADYQNIISKLIDKVGRIIFNGVPTGVEVVASMQHGGPFPSSTDSRFGSVGRGAILRFVRPMAYQNCKNEFLPDALKNENPLNIWRLVNNEWTKASVNI
jgi:NADP-dependent aldehyde dehydrogenase